MTSEKERLMQGRKLLSDLKVIQEQAKDYDFPTPDALVADYKLSPDTLYIACEDYGDTDTTYWWCGPLHRPGTVDALEDTIRIDEYLEEIAKELELSHMVEIGASENSHRFNTSDLTLAYKLFDIFKKRLSKDFKLYEE